MTKTKFKTPKKGMTFVFGYGSTAQTCDITKVSTKYKLVWYKLHSVPNAPARTFTIGDAFHNFIRFMEE